METITWHLKSFHELNVHELYAILQLREEVFIIEQNCIYQDLDDKDQKSYHLMGICEKEGLVAYSRIVPPGISFEETSIGRVISSPKVRGKSYGKLLLEESISRCKNLFPEDSIRIGAQTYLLKFYNSFGFVEEGMPYDEDGIEHIEMVLAN